jgi:hypothetical protein
MRGGAISAGETIMVVVPKADNPTVEAKVAPQGCWYASGEDRLTVSGFGGLPKTAGQEIDRVCSLSGGNVAISQQRSKI